MPASPLPLVAVDVGNNRVKLGLFEALAGRLPEPARTLTLAGDGSQLDQIPGWLGPLDVECVSWWIASVNRPAATRLIDWLRPRAPAGRVTLLACGDLPLSVALERPDMVGIDRLLDALAANRLRPPQQPAIVVDVGTAITVDLVSAEGVFQGGAIAPGLAMVAQAMHDYTDMLPLLGPADLSAPPPPVGASTVAAMRAGLFWGAVGLIRELVAQMSAHLPRPPQVFLTGGASPAVAQLLGPAATHVPHLTLAGIAVAAGVSGQWSVVSGQK